MQQYCRRNSIIVTVIILAVVMVEVAVIALEVIVITTVVAVLGVVTVIEYINNIIEINISPFITGVIWVCCSLSPAHWGLV